MDVRGDRAGRLWEIEQIYRTRLPELWRVAAAISGSREAAPDLVQEAFVRAVRRIDSFRGDGTLEGWLWRHQSPSRAADGRSS
jgi:RNA polymerase sigma factor (sigma-70 family)